MVPVGPQLQQVLDSKQVLLSQGAKQAVAAATAPASAELAAMRSTLQVLSSHLEALQATPAALDTKGGLSKLLKQLPRPPPRPLPPLLHPPPPIPLQKPVHVLTSVALST